MQKRLARLRWWLYGVAAIAVAAFGGPLLWRYRPLNADERRLAGVWLSEIPGTGGEVRFTDDHRFSFRLVGVPRVAGSWSASASKLTYVFDGASRSMSWRVDEALWSLRTGQSSTRFWDLTFETENQLRITFLEDGRTGVLRRMQNPLDPPVARRIDP